MRFGGSSPITALLGSLDANQFERCAWHKWLDIRFFAVAAVYRYRPKVVTKNTYSSETIRQCGLRPLGCVPAGRLGFRGTIRDELLAQVFGCRLWVYSRSHARAFGYLALLRMGRSDIDDDALG